MIRKIKIYCGLSISSSDVKAILPQAVAAPPIRAGDLSADIRAGVHVVGIIDGVFYQQLSVNGGELMDACRAGVKIFGSSSMGALRAAELANYGVVGVGHIYDFIKTSEAFEDDWLGQVFFDRELEPTAAFIDVVLHLVMLRDRGVLNLKQYLAAIDAGREMHFSERSPTDFADRLERLPLFKKTPASVFRQIRKPPNYKRKDALRLLEEIAAHLSDVDRFYR